MQAQYYPLSSRETCTQSTPPRNGQYKIHHLQTWLKFLSKTSCEWLRTRKRCERISLPRSLQGPNTRNCSLKTNKKEQWQRLSSQRLSQLALARLATFSSMFQHRRKKFSSSSCVIEVLHRKFSMMTWVSPQIQMWIRRHLHKKTICHLTGREVLYNHKLLFFPIRGKKRMNKQNQF